MDIDAPERPEIWMTAIDDSMLPKLIQEQFDKLKELDDGVLNARTAAGQAEKRAELAGKRSAGWSLFGDKKKEAIEGLQEAGVELAEAVQSAVKALTLSFELQTRFADVTRYLFTLGVGNIAANRTVVRELELRLAGAAKGKLSELARQEMISVVRQLKEQEDLLRKQEQMKEGLRAHDFKIKHLLDRTDDVDAQLHGVVSKIDVLNQASEKQREETLALHQHVRTHKAELESLAAGIAQARGYFEQASRDLIGRAESLDTSVKVQESQQRALTDMVESMARSLKQQQQNILTLQQQNLAQQAGIERLVVALAQSRSVLNLRTTLVAVILATLLVAAYFFC